MGTRILIRPNSLLHHRLSGAAHLSSPHILCQNNKIKAAVNNVGVLWAQTQPFFFVSNILSEDGQTGPECPPSMLMMTNERADEIWRWLWRDVKFMRVLFRRRETVIWNEYTPLIVRSLPWKQFGAKAVTCPGFVNELKMSGARTRSWQVFAMQCFYSQARGKWKKTVEAITNPHSHKGSLKINPSRLCLEHYTCSRPFLKPWCSYPGGWWSVSPPCHCRKANAPAHTTLSSIVWFKSSTAFPYPPGTFL